MSPDTDPPATGEDTGASRPTENPPTEEPLPEDPYAGLSLFALRDKLWERKQQSERREIIRALEAPPEEERPEPPPDTADLAIASSACGLRECLRPVFGDLPLDTLLGYLKAGHDFPGNPADIEKRLETQARLLDSVFGRLVEEALKKKKCDTALASAALKSQKHYRDTIRAMRDLRKVFDRLEKERDKKMSQTNYWMPVNESENNEF